MSTDSTRRRGFCADIARRLPTRTLVHLRALDAALQVLERDDYTDMSPLACVMRGTVRDIEAEERAQDEAHERERDGMFAAPDCTGLTARWCPRCGDCKCGEEMNNHDCPLHNPASPHADPDPFEQARLEELAATPIARPPTVRIGLPGDDMSDPIVVPVDSDAPAATYRPVVRVVADEGEAPDELGGGG